MISSNQPACGCVLSQPGRALSAALTVAGDGQVMRQQQEAHGEDDVDAERDREVEVVAGAGENDDKVQRLGR